MSELITRPSDNDPALRLQILRDEQGDIHVSIRGAPRDPLGTAVRFCTMSGGGRSLRTRKALDEVIAAMAEDAKEYPA